MVSVDTNVLVRLLTRDEPGQAALAASLFAVRPIWIAKTVLLECNWVLRNTYGFEEAAIRNIFTKLLGLENVHMEDESAITSAFELMASGVGFADAVHLVSRPAASVFVSFDKSLVRKAKRAGARNVSGLPLEQ